MLLHLTLTSLYDVPLNSRSFDRFRCLQTNNMFFVFNFIFIFSWQFQMLWEIKLISTNSVTLSFRLCQDIQPFVCQTKFKSQTKNYSIKLHLLNGALIFRFCSTNKSFNVPGVMSLPLLHCMRFHKAEVEVNNGVENLYIWLIGATTWLTCGAHGCELSAMVQVKLTGLVSYPGNLTKSNSDDIWSSPVSTPELHSNKSLCQESNIPLNH